MCSLSTERLRQASHVDSAQYSSNPLNVRSIHLAPMMLPSEIKSPAASETRKNSKNRADAWSADSCQREAWRSGFQRWQDRRHREAGARLLRSQPHSASSSVLHFKAVDQLPIDHIWADLQVNSTTTPELSQRPVSPASSGLSESDQLDWRLQFLQRIEGQKQSKAERVSLQVGGESTIDRALGGCRRNVHGNGEVLASPKQGLTIVRQELNADAGVHSIRQELANEWRRARERQDEAERLRRAQTDARAQEDADRMWAAVQAAVTRSRGKVKVSNIKVNPHEVYFINPTIIDRFSCGRTLDSTIDELANNRISVQDIPAIRVVRRGGKLLTFDHRRLYAFRAALPREAQIPVKLLASDVLVDQYLPGDWRPHLSVGIVRTQTADMIRSVAPARLTCSQSCGTLIAA